MVSPFTNEPMVDFDDPKNREVIRAAYAAVHEKLGRTYPLIIDGEALFLDDTFSSINPTRPDEVIGALEGKSRARHTRHRGRGRCVRVVERDVGTRPCEPAPPGRSTHSGTPARILGLDGLRSR